MIHPHENLLAEPALVEAKSAGLRYVNDQKPGFSRLRKGKIFIFLDQTGRELTDATVLQRLRSLVLPPAWTDVWICPQENGHLQATGRDARGRKQYRYHARWREARDASKYDRMMDFSRALPKIRRQVAADLRRVGLPREKVLATVVRLLEMTLIRVGNDEYAQTNRSYGLTTMRNRHVKIKGQKAVFDFVGKSGKSHHIELADPKMTKIIRRCQDLPGQELFGYRDDAGEVRHIASDEVNAYLQTISGGSFTAKDFRTWAGTILVAVALREMGPFNSEKEAKSNIVQAVAAVAKMLGNTPAICRKSYIYPVILECYLEGQTIATLRQRTDEKLNCLQTGLRPEETAVMKLLRERLSRANRRGGRRKVATL